MPQLPSQCSMPVSEKEISPGIDTQRVVGLVPRTYVQRNDSYSF